MSKRNAAPTHGWVIGSQVNKWLALVFIVSLLFWFVVFNVISYSLRRDCEDVYKRRIGFAGYWINIYAGSDKDGCPNYEL